MAEAAQGRAHRIGWARLFKRVFDIDLQRCPRCGAGDVKIVAPILERVQAASALAIGADALVTHGRDFARPNGLRVLG